MNRGATSSTGGRSAVGRPVLPMLAPGVVCAALSTILIAVSKVEPVDLAVYRASGYSLIHGIGLYGNSFPAALPFTYPPFAAWPLVVLVPTTWQFTIWWWTFLTLVLIGWVIARSFAQFLPDRPWQRAAVLAGLIGAFSIVVPVSDHIGFGQINVLLMAVCLADLLGVRPRWLPAGVLIGLAAAVKLVPAIFILYLVITRRVRTATIAAATALAATGLAYAVRPADSRLYFFDLLWHLDARVGLGNNATIGNQSVQGALLRLLPGPAVHPTWLISVLVCLGAGMVGARRARALRGEIAGACAVGLVAVLVSPVSWTHYLVWMIPAVGVMLGDGKRKSGRRTAVFVYVVLVSRIHRLGQNLIDRNPAWPLRIVGDLSQNGYLLLCIGTVIWLALHPDSNSRPWQWVRRRLQAVNGERPI